MGTAAGGRGALPLIAVAVLMASGVAGVTVFNSGRGHISGHSRTAQVLGTAIPGASGSGRSSSGTGGGAAQSAGGPGSASGLQASGSAAGRYNVGAPHSPELLKKLGGPLADTGHPALKHQVKEGAFAAEPSTSATAAPGPSATPGSPASPPTPSPAGTPGPAPPRSPFGIEPSAPPLPKGIDVASYQHPHGAAIDWPQVAGAGYTFAAIKATEGNYYTNPYYASDLSGAEAAGLYATGYHFAIPNVSSGTSQADYAVGHGNYTADDGHTLPLELDVEYDPYTGTDHTNECYGLTPAAVVSWISAFGAEVKRLTGQFPIIYTTADWWDACTGNSVAFGSDPLWVAAYATASPPRPAGWNDWTCWQYTSSGTVPGISTAGGTDLSYFSGDQVTLADPGNQQNTPGATVSLQVNSLNSAAGQSLSYTATGLPPGLSISSAGQITGTIATRRAGSYAVTVTATGPTGLTGSVSFTWSVPSQSSPGGPAHK